jgi:hypothetical protein
MAKIQMQQNVKGRWTSADGLYAAAIVIWIIGTWGGALYMASEATADASAGVGGNSSLLACILATAVVITAFSVREFLAAYKRLIGNGD